MEQQPPLATLPAVLQWPIGRKLVTVLNDSRFPDADPYFTHVPEGGLQLQLQRAFRSTPAALTTNVFLIQSDDHAPVLIDTGMGAKMAPAIQGRLREALAFIGVQPADIGFILLTHLHGDHYYGLLDEHGQKAFPNARVWVSETEAAYWFDNADLSEYDQQNAAYARLALQPYEPLRAAGPELLPGITPVPLPGHTPGQTGFRLQSADEELLFCADVLNLPAVQAALPQVGFATDVDHALAVQTRIRTLQQAADRRLLLAGAHFEYPCLHYVEKDGTGFRLIPRQWL
ncbi:MBL fold metallo-hydrolase [Hymenobacter jeollabukensis]|uniref:MBL fold metallo-hydrolase n=1 Tax=Hymenobacter jeollabukensis TaxID=2025313 RepID=A0A5R8WUT9_9BACT|nr:MBL fold metallo-hydrolase [Hymenobacter jeollabukensis]TLM95542.1 MBL fold metallo-hydrolase [Hymenobacter jeollabukensis]